MEDRLLDVTVVVPAKNEEKNLGKCLKLLGRFAEVVVIDSSSTDATPQIAAECGARYANFIWDGKFPKKRNWFLLNHAMKTGWVLFLDADEFVTDSFCDEVAKSIKDPSYNAYWLNYSSWFLGRQLRYGVPQRKLALFRTGSGFYERIEEENWSSLDMEIHEHPIISGRIGVINAKIDHNDDRGILKFVDRHRDYAAWEANRTILLRNDPAAWDNLSARQKFKYSHISKWWYPCFYFAIQYFGKLGLLDGSAGLQLAFYKLWYFNTIRLLIKAERNPSSSNSNSIEFDKPS